MRALRAEIPRRSAEVAVLQTERHEDVLVDIPVPGVAGELLDDAAEVDVGGIRVAELLARRERQLLVRHHRHQLRPLGRLERLPRLTVAVGPGGTLKPRRVVEQHANRDLVNPAVRIVHAPQLRNVAGDLVLQRQPPFVPQLQNGNGREHLGDRAPVEDRVVIHEPFRRSIAVPGIVLGDHLPVAHVEDAGADHLVRLDVGVELPHHLRPAARSLRSSDRGQEARERNRAQDARLRHGNSSGVWIQHQDGNNDAAWLG